MIPVSTTEYLHTNAVLLWVLKSWRLAHKTLNSYLPSLDCKNMGQISWLNFHDCGFQAPTLVRPFAAWVRTSLLILSGFASLGSREKGKENPGCCPANWPRHLDSFCHGQCGPGGCSYPSSKLQCLVPRFSSEHLYTAFKDSCSLSLNNFPYLETSSNLGPFCRITGGKKPNLKLVCDSSPSPKIRNLFSMAYRLRINFKSKSGEKDLILLLFIF